MAELGIAGIPRFMIMGFPWLKRSEALSAFVLEEE
jgi:hypothetical protein